MATERTLSIVKPDAVENGNIGNILGRFEKEGLKIIAMKLTWLSETKAKEFYAVHKERPFFKDLINYMVSGPVVISALEGENAILKHREIMGATNPSEAADGTLRKLYGESIERNACHGSDAAETAAFEIGHFFAGLEVQQYERKK